MPDLYANLDISTILATLVLLAVSFGLAFPMAWDREQAEETLGMRTFPLVAMASCGFVLLGQDLGDSAPNAHARVLAGLITGIGFLGGGAILKEGMNVRGSATAAAIWGTAAIGAAVAYLRFDIAIVMAVAGFATLRWLGPLKKAARDHADSEED